MQLRLVGLAMMCAGLHLAYSGSNISMIKLQFEMAISEDIPAGHICYIVLLIPAVVCNTWE